MRGIDPRVWKFTCGCVAEAEKVGKTNSLVEEELRNSDFRKS